MFMNLICVMCFSVCGSSSTLLPNKAVKILPNIAVKQSKYWKYVYSQIIIFFKLLWARKCQNSSYAETYIVLHKEILLKDWLYLHQGFHPSKPSNPHSKIQTGKQFVAFPSNNCVYSTSHPPKKLFLSPTESLFWRLIDTSNRNLAMLLRRSSCN